MITAEGKGRVNMLVVLVGILSEMEGVLAW